MTAALIIQSTTGSGALVVQGTGLQGPTGPSGQPPFGLNSTNAGAQAMASGLQCTASGDYAWAGGWLSVASGRGSFAFGYKDAVGARATGDDSFAWGVDSLASGPHSICIAAYGTSSGAGSVVVGENSQATNANAAVFGYASLASGPFATACGSYCYAYGQGSFACGIQSAADRAGEFSHGSGHAGMQGGKGLDLLKRLVATTGNLVMTSGAEFASVSNTLYRITAKITAGTVGLTKSASEDWVFEMTTGAGTAAISTVAKTTVGNTFVSQGWSVAVSVPGGTNTLRFSCDAGADTVTFAARLEWTTLTPT